MFVLTKEELTDWRSQNVTSKSDRMGLRHPPMAFSEQDVAMRSSVLRSNPSKRHADPSASSSPASPSSSDHPKSPGTASASASSNQIQSPAIIRPLNGPGGSGTIQIGHVTSNENPDSNLVSVFDAQKSSFSG
ncbi:MAG: ORF6N domain-containing protein [Lentisphaeria bacterium]|nr:ORF6N domain-containing protein [Lentisphaeria bacterium]